jgi:hypothetical protein
LEGLGIEIFGTSYDHLPCFMAIWHVLCIVRIVCGHLGYFYGFGTLYQEKSGRPVKHGLRLTDFHFRFRFCRGNTPNGRTKCSEIKKTKVAHKLFSQSYLIVGLLRRNKLDFRNLSVLHISMLGLEKEGNINEYLKPGAYPTSYNASVH